MVSRPGGSSRPGPSGSRGRGTRRPANPSTSRGSAPKPPQGSGGSRFTTRAVVLLSIVLLLLASYTSSLRTWWDQRQEIRATEEEIVLREQAIAELKDDAARWDDPAFVKQQARDRFGWVLPGEVGYRVIGADGRIEGEAPTLDAPTPLEPPDWKENLWQSVLTAGEKPAERRQEAEVPEQVLQQQEPAG